MRKSSVGIGVILWSSLAAVSVSGGLAADSSPAAGGSVAPTGQSVAFFAASSQNGFNAAVYEGVARAGAALGISTSIFDGEFNAEVQLTQMEDATASGQFDGFALLANDTVGIASAVTDAYAAGIPTVTTLFPIGPDLTTLEKQVEGIVGTVARPPGDGAKLQADAVVAFCADKDPCNVVILIGQLQYPFDKVRYDTFTTTLAEHGDIKLVATGEGNYDRDTSLTAMQDILQANSVIHAVLSNADQHLSGAEIAISDASLSVEDLFLVGAGATQDAIDAVRSGRWDATLADYPRTMGERALQILVQDLAGEAHDSVVNEDSFYDIGPLLTTADLVANPGFVAEWQG